LALPFCLDIVDFFLFYLFTTSATTEVYPLSLHDALPISGRIAGVEEAGGIPGIGQAAQLHRRQPQLAARQLPVEHRAVAGRHGEDRKSTRLNSSHVKISYAVFCLKKKKT